MHRFHSGLGLFVILSVGLTACGDDADDGDGASGGSAGTGGSAGGGKGGTGSGGKGGASTGGKGGTASGGGDTGGSATAGGSAGTSTGGAGSSGTDGSGGGGEGGEGGEGGGSATGGSGGMAGEAGMSGDAGMSGMSGDAGMSGQAGAGGEGGEGEVRDFWGNGADGALGVESVTNLGTDNSGTRSCADGGDAVSYSVTSLGASTAQLATEPAAGCLAVGDEVLIINLQGTESASGNVGHYETLIVSAISETGLSFSREKTRFYGEAADDDTNIGVARTNQRVMLQRVPNYSSVNVAAAGTLTGQAWDGAKGGVLFFRASGAVTIAGAVSMAGKGYEGGLRTDVVNTNGLQGESFHGLGVRGASAHEGGGGGGLGDNNGCEGYGTSGGGGGYATPGEAGTNECSGDGGDEYGDMTLLTKLMLGSGGGGGGADDYLGDNPPGGYGGRGGGIVVVLTNELDVSGSLSSTGSAGEGDVAGDEPCDGGSVSSCWDYSGPGGGGSGGAILLQANQAMLGTGLVAATGGLGGRGLEEAAGDGGQGASGRIALGSADSLEGTTMPTAHVNE